MYTQFILPLKNILSSLLYLTTSKSSLLIKSLINNRMLRFILDNISLILVDEVFVFVVCTLGVTYNLDCCDLLILNTCCFNRKNLKESEKDIIATNKRYRYIMIELILE